MKPKIALIASYPGSLLNFRLALMQEFLAHGYEVVAIAPYDKEVMEALAAFNIRYIPIVMERNGLNPFADLILINALRNILLKEQPDLVFSYTIKPVIYGSIAAKLAKIPKIYSMITGTGYVFLNNNFKSKLVGLIARAMFKFALQFNDLVFFQNKDNLEYFKSLKILSSKKPAAVINGSGVNCNEFSPQPYPSSVTFLMIARFLYDKGIREYIQAAQHLKQKFPQIKCQLVGWIDTNPNSMTHAELEACINDGSIEYLGKLSDVRPAIAGASVYVLPSYHEGTPRTVLEAMAMARPIVTTDAAGCKETVNGKNGFLVPVKSVTELIKAMEYFIQQPEQILIMGAESRKFVVEKYDVDKVNLSILTAMGVKPKTIFSSHYAVQTEEV